MLTPPAQVTTWFSEPLEPGISSIRVLDGAGQQVSQGQVAFDPGDRTRMTVTLADDLPPGFYRVIWETLSRIDGHIRLGSFTYTVLNPDGSLPAGPRPPTVPAAVGPPDDLVPRALVKFLGLVSAVAVVGSLAFTLLVTRPAVAALPQDSRPAGRRMAAAPFAWLALPALVLLALTGLAELLLQARQLGGMDELGRILGTTWGERWLWRQVVLGALTTIVVVVVARDARRGSPSVGGGLLWAALLVSLGYLLLVSATSHAAAIPVGSVWATLIDAIHLAAAAIWVGGLLQLAVLLGFGWRTLPEQHRPVLVATALGRFSLLAATSVVLLLGSGVVNAFVHVPSLAALVETAYGRALAAKLALTLLLLAVAGVNAFVLRPRFVQAAATGGSIHALRRRLARLAVLEAALGLGVLASVAVLVHYPTVRSAVAPLAGGRGPVAFPLVAGSWVTLGGIALVMGGALLWVWAGHWSGAYQPRRRVLRTAGLGMPIVGLILVLGSLATAPAPASPPVARQASPEGTPAPAASPPAADGPGSQDTLMAAIALRYQTGGGWFVLLEVAPFAVGENTFRVTLLDGEGQPLRVEAVTLRLSRLEQTGGAREFAAVAAPDSRSAAVQATLPETGWWAIEVLVAGTQAANFYVRLDDPSGAPLSFNPPAYQSDREAERLFRNTVNQYERLASLKWREELTSGLLAPTGIGAWVLTRGEASVPNRLHLRVLSPGFSDYELFRVGNKSCTKPKGRPWECRTIYGENPFDLEYQAPATAFRLGRREPVDGEMTQVLLFYNRQQSAWYAWWVGEETGHLRRQAMVAPGHFMLTRFFEHNVPVEIPVPPAGRPG